MDKQLIATKIGFDDNTVPAIMQSLASEPELRDRSPEELEDLLFEVLGVLTGDSSRDEFPRTETDRTIFKIARVHLEPEQPNGLTQRLAWLSLWFSRQCTATA